MLFAVLSMSSAEVILVPASTSASGILGVMMSAFGKSSVVSTLIASSLISLAPDVATITGSRTTFFALYLSRYSAIVLISSPDATMPILTASGKISEKTLSSCKPKNCGVTSMIPLTPVVFCAVRAVTALMPS